MIFGRSAELASITSTLTAISTGGAALVIDGEAGIGKSTLLSTVADWAVANGYSRLGRSRLRSVHEPIHPLTDELSPLERARRPTGSDVAAELLGLADECENQRGAARLLLQQGRIEGTTVAAKNAPRMAQDINLPMTVSSAAVILARVQVWQGRSALHER